MHKGKIYFYLHLVGDQTVRGKPSCQSHGHILNLDSTRDQDYTTSFRLAFCPQVPFLIIHHSRKGFVGNHGASSFSPTPASSHGECQPALCPLTSFLEHIPQAFLNPCRAEVSTFPEWEAQDSFQGVSGKAETVLGRGSVHVAFLQGS